MKRYPTIPIGLLLIMFACVDPISFETVDESGQPVFYGNFSQLDQNHHLRISLTSPVGEIPTPVTGACVEIVDNAGNSAFYEELEPGQYQLTPDRIQGIPGRTYHVEIMLSDGTSYRSVPQVMPEAVEADDIYFEIERRSILSESGRLVDKTFIDIFIDTPLRSQAENGNHLRWTVEEVYSFVDRSCGPFDLAETCYFIDPVDESEVLLFENEGSSQNYYRGLNVRSRELVPFDEFTARHYFIVTQYTISDEELNYWKKINAVANQSGSLFDVQPARVPGNMYKQGEEDEPELGYFGVNGQSVLRIFTTPFSIRPNPVFTCMDDSFFVNHLPECCNCFTKQGIQIERPEYWDD